MGVCPGEIEPRATGFPRRTTDDAAVDEGCTGFCDSLADANRPVQRVVIPGELVVRDSVGRME